MNVHPYTDLIKDDSNFNNYVPFLGNDNIFALTNQKLYSARFDLKDVAQNRSYALYDKFWIADEDHNYTLHISVYTGEAGNFDSNFYNFILSVYFKLNAYLDRLYPLTFWYQYFIYPRKIFKFI